MRSRKSLESEKKILLHHGYIRTTRQCLRAEVDLSQSEEADLTNSS